MDGSGGTVRGRDRADLEPIAIVGVSCRFPGASDLAAFERVLDEGRDVVSEVPDSRWTKSRFLNRERGQRGKTYTFAAGVLDSIDGFDPAFFGISPREAAQMDPQQRLLLELAHEAVEDAGLDGAKLAGSETGVFVGGSSWDYLTLHSGDPGVLDAYSMTGATLCSLSNRVSYVFDLRGPSFTVDTACSSSLVALHQACEALRAGMVPMAFVGAVNLLLAPHAFVGFSAASMLSPTGRCHAFDERADGYVRAEGGAMLLLRPLREALACGDAIRGVIRATGVNSDGRTTGFSLPNKAAQAALLRDVYGRFGIDPSELSYLEAHGTGTPAGDPIEAAALGEALGQRRSVPLPIGSVKTNIGHMEAASGMAGVLKVVSALARGVVPASLHSETPNPLIPFETLNLSLVRERMALPGGGGLAGVNSFGFGGANAHAVIGSAPAPAQWDQAGSGDSIDTPLLLSARSEGALRALAVAWKGLLESGEVDGALVRGAALAREQHGRRLVVAPGDAGVMAGHLGDWLAERATRDVVAGEAVSGRVAFVYSGNGSQWAGMGVEAAERSACFQDTLAEVDGLLQPLLGWSVLERLGAVDGAAMLDTTVAQPLLFAVQVATTEALRAAGVRADLYMGHSVGEIAAAWAAGGLSLEQACRVVAVRSRLQARTAGHGRMAVLGMDSARASAALLGTGLEIAAINGSSAVTVAGPGEAIEELGERAKRERWAFTEMALDHAFHSAAMDPIKTALLAELAGLDVASCPGSFVSTVTGAALHHTARLDGSYWWHNVREPVDFARGADSLIADGARIFVEIGPQPVLQAYLNDALRRQDVAGRALPSLVVRPVGGRDPIALAAARCHAAGCDVRVSRGFAGPVRHRGLPSYPWQRARHWRAGSVESTDIALVAMEHPLLGARRDAGEALDWVQHVGPSAQGWLADHVVGGAIVVPAAGLIEMGLAAGRSRFPAAAALDLFEFEIARPLTLEVGVLHEVRLRMGQDSGDFTIASRPRFSEDGWVVHASGRVADGGAAGAARAVPAAIGAGERIGAEAVYAVAEGLGLGYGPAFRGVAGVVMAAGLPGVDVDLAAPEAGLGVDGGMLLAPTVLDGAFQGLLALGARLLPDGDGVLPWRFGRVRLLRPGGVVPGVARLRVARVGPRAVRADVALLDEDGVVVAEVLDAWFVRVALGMGRGGVEAWGFHTAWASSADPRLAGLAGGMLEVALGGEAAGDEGPGEAGLLADAFVAAAGEEVVRGMLPAGAEEVGLADVAGPGRGVLEQVMGWLELDGLAAREGSAWRLLGGLEVAADDILASLAFETPGAAADAALLAWGVGRLGERMRGGGEETAPGALLEQFVHGSPAGVAAAGALVGAVGRVAAGWPAGQPLRVLQVGARRGTFSRLLLRAVPGILLDAVTGGEDQLALGEALAGFDGARAVVWADGVPPEDAGPYDLVVGYCPVSLGAVAGWGAVLRLAAGGLALMVEPAPNRAWAVVWPEAGRRQMEGAGWCAAWAAAGAEAVEARTIDAAWPASLVVGRVPARAVAARGPGDWAVLGDAGDGFAGGVAAGLEAAGAEVVRWSLADAGVLPGRVAVVVPGGDAAIWVSRVVRWVAGLPEGGRLVVLVRDGVVAGALTGLRRVMANESPDVGFRLVRLGADVGDAAGLAVEELLRPDGEAEVWWSGAGRAVPRVRRGVGGVVSGAGALRLGVGRPGLLDTLGWDAVGAPEAPGAGQVVIRVRAAGLNFRDVMWGLGLLPDEALLDGFAGPTFGLECAGEVCAVGADVGGLAVGDRVMAFAPASMGTHATSVAHAVMRMPEGMGFAAAATVPVAFLTVAYALGHLARVRAGELVLVHGGAGGVGLAAIQYARLRGARVIATAGSEAKRALLRRLGVEAVLDSRSLEFADEVMRLTGGEGVDVVLNSLSGEAMERSLGVLRPFGRFLELGKRDFYGNTSVGLRPFRHNVSYFGVDADQLPLRRPELAAELFAEVAGLMREGALRPLPYRAFAADDAAEAFRLMQASGHVGKVVLELDGAGPVARRVSAAAVNPVRGDRVYLVTGGLSGFGLETARWLARQGARQLALVGRRGAATVGADDVLAGFAAEGVHAVAYAGDVADERAMAGVLAAVRRGQGVVGGVVHAAVAMDDGLLTTMTEARFAAAMRTKLGGVEVLDRLTRADPIEMFVAYSSVTTVLGNPGQANYVAANGAVEAVMEARHGAGLPGLAVQWGPIGDAGYLSREKGVAKMLSKQLGGRLLTAADALDALPALLAAGRAVVGLADVRWGGLGASLPLLRSPLFEALYDGSAAPAAEVDVRELLANCTPEEAQAKLAELLTEEVARIMKTSAASIQGQRPLAELGMDSLMAIELRLAVEQRFGLTVPVLALSEGATVNGIAGRMARAIQAGGGGVLDAEAARLAERMNRFEAIDPAVLHPGTAEAAD